MADGWLLWLADELRGAGLHVEEYAGWEKRSRSSGPFEPGRPWIVMWHHSASQAAPEDDAAYCATGAEAAPICNVVVDRNGVVWLLAAGATNCVVAGTTVVTRRGVLAIEDVVVGDEVWTHRERWRPVVGTHAFPDREVVALRPNGWSEIVGTPDHPWLTYGGWVRKRGLDRWKPNAPEFRLMSDLGAEHRLIYATAPEVAAPSIEGFRVTPELARFIGAYAADGHTGPWAVSLTVRNEKAPIVEGWAHAAGLDVGVRPHGGKAQRVQVRRATPLARFLDEHVGKGAASKRVPLWISGTPKLAEAFLEGYLHGDGWWSPKAQTWVATTVSRALAVGLGMCARTVGWHATAQRVAAQPGLVIDGKVVADAHDCWRVRLLPHRPVRRVEIEGRATTGVRHVVAAGRATVYDITVDEDHSFVADGLICHNTNGSGIATSTSKGTIPADSMNTYAFGMEISNSGVGEPYPQAQIDAAFIVSNVVNRHMGNQPTDVGIHAAYSPGRKIDPAKAVAVQGPWRPHGYNGSTDTWVLDDVMAECALRAAWEPGPQPTTGEIHMYLIGALGPNSPLPGSGQDTKPAVIRVGADTVTWEENADAQGIDLWFGVPYKEAGEEIVATLLRSRRPTNELSTDCGNPDSPYYCPALNLAWRG